MSSGPSSTATPRAATPTVTARPTLALPATSGALTATAIRPLPGAVGGVLDAEAPDGTVFVIPVAASAASGGRSVGSIAYVVDGDSAPAVAEHLDAPGVAILADSSDLYVFTTRDLTAYDRDTGAVVRTWPVVLTPGEDDADVALAGGRLWAYATGGVLDEISPRTSSVADRGVIGPDVAGIAADATGAYYVKADGATIVRVSPDGTTTAAPTHVVVDAELSGAGAVTPVVSRDGVLIVRQDFGQGLDAALLTYDAATLARTSSAGTDVAGATVVPTLAGDLVADSGGTVCGSTSSTPACVARSTIATATARPCFVLPAGETAAGLLGPYPAVFGVSAAGVARLYRLH